MSCLQGERASLGGQEGGEEEPLENMGTAETLAPVQRPVAREVGTHCQGLSDKGLPFTLREQDPGH